MAFIDDSITEKLFHNKNLEFEIFLKFNNLSAGISQKFSNLSECKKYYSQAIKALEIGQRQNINPSFFEDCVLFIASNLITKDYDLMDFCHPAIIFLIYFDKKNEIELLKTLKNYIFYTNSPNKAAKVLCIHRNTLFYRINKIKDMTGIKLDNATEICKTYLSIKLLEINGILDFLLV